MNSIWILEDEYFILDSISKLIGTEFPISNVISFQSALDALNALNNDIPDIVITDIVMGEYSGLDFVFELRKRTKTSEVIIISGHENFNYAKESISLGVAGYLLKPINRSKLIELVETLINKINGLQDHIPSSFESQLATILAYKNNLPLGVETKLSTQMNLLFASFSVCIFQDKSSNTFKAKECIDNIFSFSNSIHISIQEKNHRILLVSNLDRNLFYCAVVSSIHTISELHNSTLNIGLSSVYTTVHNFYNAYTEAESSLEQGTFKEETPDWEKNLSQISESFFKMLAKGCFMEIPKYLLPILDITIADSARYKQVSDVLDYVYKSVFSLIRPYTTEDMPNLESIETLKPSEKRKMLLRLFDVLRKTPSLSHYSKKCLICDIAFEIIDNNLENASLYYVADRMGISSNYLSRIYLEVYNSSLKRYIILAKIKEAKRLLETTEDSFSEIGNKVGYSDEKYFKKIFTNLTGIEII